MSDLLFEMLNVVGPVLLCAAIGFAWAKLKQPFHPETLTAIITNIGFPCLLISHISEQHISIEAFSELVLAALAAVVAFAVIAGIVLKLMRLSLRAYLSSMMFANTGNIGIPVAVLAFGADGMAYAIAFYVIVLTGLFTVGIALPQGSLAFRRLLTTPAIYAVLIGLALVGTDTKLPPPILHAFEILGGLAIPLMLLTLGFTLATLKASSLPLGFGLAAFHLVMAMAVAWSLTELFQFEGDARGVFILQCVMPVALTNYLFTQKYDPDNAQRVASLALFSTLLAIISLPLILAFWVR